MKEIERELQNLIYSSCAQYPDHKNFDAWVEDRIWQERYSEKEIATLEQLIPDLAQKNVLDVGSGMGGFVVAMNLKKYQCEGLEPNPLYAKITRLRGIRYNLPVRVTISGGETMPYPNASFDVVRANDVLEHCKDPQEILHEIYRILRPEGIAYISIINRFGFNDPHYHLPFINWLPRKCGNWFTQVLRKKDCDHMLDNQKLLDMHYFTFKKFKHLAHSCNFSVLDLGLEKMRKPELILSPAIQKRVTYLKRFYISVPLYLFLRTIYLSGFSCSLKKNTPNVCKS